MGPLNSAGRFFDAIVLGSDLLASLWIFGLMMLMNADVFMRYFFNAPISGVNEIMEISIVAMLYLQVTQALKDNRHTRSDAFFSTILLRKPRAGRLMSAFFSVSGLLLMVAILWGAVPRVLQAYRSNYTIGTRGIFIVPEWPVDLVICFGCTLMAVQFAIFAVTTLRAHRQAGRG